MEPGIRQGHDFQMLFPQLLKNFKLLGFLRYQFLNPVCSVLSLTWDSFQEIHGYGSQRADPAFISVLLVGLGSHPMVNMRGFGTSL